MKRPIMISLLLGSFWVALGLVLATPVVSSTHLDVATPTPAGPTATPLVDVIGWGGFDLSINPLTGLSVPDPSVLERRPLAVKISNAPAEVRPQAGIAQADLVFEHYVEGFLTRFTAIFYGNSPPYVGSVRSARLIDLQLPLMYDALFAFSGANGPILLRLTESRFRDRIFENVGEPLFYREPTIEAPHNLFIRPAEIWARATTYGVNQRPELRGLLFSEAMPPHSVSFAERVVVFYGPDEAEWRYDVTSGTYLRWSDGQPHLDALDGRQVAAANVVMIWAHHQEDVTIVASEWEGEIELAFEVQIWSLGPATLFRDGRRFDGFWHRWQDEVMLTFWHDDTMVEPLYLKPGITWFQVVPLDFKRLFVQARLAEASQVSR